MSQIQKSEVVQKVVEVLLDKINVMKKSVEFAHITATHEETQAKSKYDTFALEASYLANGQSKRLADLEQSLLDYQNLILKDYAECDVLGIGALVSLQDDDGQTKCYFLAPSSGGIVIKINGVSVTTVTQDSPMGSQLFGARFKSTIECHTRNQLVSYEIINVI